MFLRLILLAAIVFSSLHCSQPDDTPPRILIFSKTEGYRHDCIATGTAAIRKMCIENGIAADSSEDANIFTEQNLKRYNAVVFMCTTGDVLNPTQEADFERYIQAGGGFVGIHSATDTEYGWGWFGDLVGAYFLGHPAQQDATLKVENHDHPATSHLKDDLWKRRDEWYNFKDFNPDVKVLLSIDESSYQGGTMCPPGTTTQPCHPMSWYHEYDGGRAFYTALGHTKESYVEPDFMKHVLGGIRYAIGKKKRLNYTACRTPEQPDPTRFVKTVLADELTEPMELDMFPNGKVMLIERRGALKMYDPSTGLLNIVAHLSVHSEHEDGLMGFAIDPNYASNQWIYLYYSPPGKVAVNNLSRFVFRGDSLEKASEKIILQVAVQREECCHTGGSIAFDKAGNLYLSTGDNTNPFASEGYSPSDEGVGRSAWDAQKSSANTMDLRGKILRITPRADGTYSIPKGNLFAESDGRPEIYIMGCRNPFRISLDHRRNLLFWGEVGPDAGEPDSTKGPAGHDEVNRAREAGFYGWPYFVGNNKPYNEYDFKQQKSGALYDAAHPINNSPNNKGLTNLPPAQPAFIWYPYSISPEFPLVGVGGRNAMAGPVYYCDEYPEKTRLPNYYDGKLITYDWIRGWMMAVTIDSKGDFSRMEPFADSLRFSRPMDMIVDKNGSLWVLEYGTQWFAKNSDARLSKVDYVQGNRPPIALLSASKTTGAAPTKVFFSVSKSKDYDDSRLRYELDFGDGTKGFSKEMKWKNENQNKTAAAHALGKPAFARRNPLDSIEHTYTQVGLYEIVLKVTDGREATNVRKLKIRVGNEPPEVAWNLGGHNRSFYKAGDTIQYTLEIIDREDGSLEMGTIRTEQIATSIDFLETGFDITTITQGHQTAKKQVEYARGKTLIDRSDCKTCHAEDRKINGPSFQDIATKYRGNDFAVRNLSGKIIKGGAGVWGQTVMSAHPQISETDAGDMVRWILTLGDAPKPKQNFPTQGQYILATKASTEKKKDPIMGTYIFNAVYTDRGSRSQKPLDGNETLALRPAFQQAEQADSMSQGLGTYRPFKGDTVVVKDLKHNGFVMYKHCDLRGIHGISVGVGSSDAKYAFHGGRAEVHAGSPQGKLLGKGKISSKNSKKMQFEEIYIPLDTQAMSGFQDLYIVLKNESNPSQPVAALDWIRFELR